MASTSKESGFMSMTHRGVALWLIVAGGLLLIARPGSSGPLAYLVSAGLIATGFGVWRFQRWARWMALGACFLGLFYAIVLTFGVFLFRLPEGSDGRVLGPIVVSVIACAFGAFGYQGLGYLRSERGRVEFSGSAATQEKLLAERSSAVAISACVWVALLLVSWFPRQLSPIRLFQKLAPTRVDSSTAKPPRYFALLRQRGTSGSPTTPDLIPLGLCYRDHIRERVIHIVYTNAGGNRDRKEFRYGTSKDFSTVPTLLQERLLVPARDKLAFAEYRLASDMPQGKFLVHLDIGNAIHEKDEGNNSAQFELPVDVERDETPPLPECSAVKLREVRRDGPTITAATVRPPDVLPDLVPLGLCAREQFQVSLRYTNRGPTAPGHFWISQGQSEGDLEVKENLQHSVPASDEARGFSIGTLSEVVGKRGASVDVFIKVDAVDSIQESNEMNNIVSARVTRGADGRVDLPDCDALAQRAADHDWMADDVVLQPAFVPMPDLVPVGLCIKEWGAAPEFHSMQIVYGNIGNTRRPEQFRVTLHDEPKSNRRYVDRLHVPSPDGIGLQDTLRKQADVRERETVTLDTANVVSELNESNNTVEFVVARKADGTVDLPDCESVRGRASDWIGKMNPVAGPE
jgi:hypothetical protein